MTNYYVDQTLGNDGGAGTEADPWKTVAKINATALLAGDTVHFMRGEVWYERLVADRSGSAGSPVTYKDYGSGALPRISAAQVVTGWVATVGSEYKKTGVLTEPYVVYEDDVYMTVGAAAGALNAGEFIYLAGPNELHVRCFDNADPDTHVMERSEVANALQIVANTDYNNFENIRFEKGNTITCDIESPVAGSGSEYLNFTGVDFYKSAWILVQVGHSAGNRINPDNVTFSNCTFTNWDRVENTAWAGLHVRAGDGNHGQNITVIECTFTNDLAYGVDLNTTQDAIWMESASTILIESNVITGCAHAISLNDCTGWTIRYNLIHDIADDCFYLMNCDDETGEIDYNLVYRVSDNFIDLVGTGGTGAKNFGSICNNTFYECVNWAVSIGADDGSTAVIKNNSFTINQNPSQRFYLIYDVSFTIDMSDFDIDYNLYYDEVDSPGTTLFALYESAANKSWSAWQTDTGNDTHSPTPIDPQYVDAANDDYTPDEGSPLINSGQPTGYPRDYVGTLVPQQLVPDIGAIETSYWSCLTYLHSIVMGAFDTMPAVTDDCPTRERRLW